MIKMIDVSFNMNVGMSNPAEVIDSHKEGHGYARFIKEEVNTTIIEHMNFEGEYMDNGVQYHFFKGRNKFWYVPFKTNKFIRQSNPDIILVQGLIFPLQVIFLRLRVAKKCKILVQHHGEHPFKNWKRIFQRIAVGLADGYLFTACGNAKEWMEQKIVREDKCYEVLEASTFFEKQNKQESRSKLGIARDDIFLWVGRLEKNKDPITILKGFEQYLRINANALLYMIYQEDDLLAEVKSLVYNSDSLKRSVHLIGKIDHNALPIWFSAADFYLSGSHVEGSGYALIEAMACGCIPIVTDIPPFRKITGGHGFLFEPGNPDSLYNALTQSSVGSKAEKSKEITEYFKSSLSFNNIADDIFRICKKLTE